MIYKSDVYTNNLFLIQHDKNVSYYLYSETYIITLFILWGLIIYQQSLKKCVFARKARFLRWWPGGGGGGRWGGGNVFTVHSFTERCAVCGEQRGPGPGNKSSCPQELQLGNNTTKLLHPGSGSHLSRVLGSDF